METAIKTAENDDSAGRVLEAVVMRGDIASLSPKDRVAYYLQLCDSLHLNPATQPIKFIVFQGKMIPYFARDATDQLAAMHRLNREVVAGPEVRDYCGHKLLYALCRATHPNGRVETATALVPIPNGGGEALANAVMKTETKSRRRATLAMLGLGFIDESELDTMAGARRLSHAEAMGETAAPVDVNVRQLPARAANELWGEPDAGESPELGPNVFDAIRDDLASLGWRDDGESVPVALDEAAAVWLDHKAALTTGTARAAWQLLMKASNAPSTAALKRAVASAEKKATVRASDNADAPANDAPTAAEGA